MRNCSLRQKIHKMTDFEWILHQQEGSADITLVVLKKEFRSQYSTKYLLALLNSRHRGG